MNWELNNLQDNYIPKVTLEALYQQGDLDTKSEAEYAISINLSTSLSFTKEKSEEAHKRAEIIIAQMNYKQMLRQLKSKQKLLKEEIKTHLKNLQLSQKSIKWAQKNLKENTRLYNIGKVDFNHLVSAEEKLIYTERSYANNWFHYERTIAQNASLYAKLLEVIRSNNI